jgi:archaellum component FlaF (FlaF/FlaG flagellin family)
MDTAIAGLIVITILVLAMLTLFHSFLSAQDTISASWQQMTKRMEERARTDLSPVGAETTPLGNAVEITLSNEGDTKLADFEQWDVILQYTDSDGHATTTWCSFGSGQNQWTKTIDELFEPGILNPGEEMVIEALVSPAVGSPSTNTATVATPNGITATAVFTH